MNLLTQSSKSSILYYHKKTFIKEIISNRYLYLLCLPGLLFFCIFGYLPMFGAVMAFQNFNPVKGIWGSSFNGLDNFRFFLENPDWIRVTFNTVFLNFLFIVFGIIFQIMVAISLSEVSNRVFKRFSQSFMLLPYFISWTVVSMFATAFLSSDNGYINNLLKLLNLQTVNFYGNAAIWPLILVILNIWQGTGWGSVIYLAAIAGINQEIYESARIDGTSRLQSIIHITLPMLANTTIMLFILAVGRIFIGNFAMIFAMIGNNSLLFSTTEVIDTYVYRMMSQMNEMGISSAIGLYQSVVGFVLVVAANSISKRFSSDAALF